MSYLLGAGAVRRFWNLLPFSLPFGVLSSKIWLRMALSRASLKLERRSTKPKVTGSNPVRRVVIPSWVVGGRRKDDCLIGRSFAGHEDAEEELFRGGFGSGVGDEAEEMGGFAKGPRSEAD